jgi:hypothetical protein
MAAKSAIGIVQMTSYWDVGVAETSKTNGVVETTWHHDNTTSQRGYKSATGFQSTPDSGTQQL